MPSSQWGREHPDEIDTPDEAEFVPVVDAHEHGFHGRAVDLTDRAEFTVAGVVKAAEAKSGAGVESEGVDTDAPRGKAKAKHADDD